MTNKRTVKDHLGNEELYTPVMPMVADQAWKRRLLDRCAQGKKVAVPLHDERSPWLIAATIALPILSVAAAAASYFGFINTASLSESFSTAANFNIPAIGLKEAVVFALLVNVAVFLIKKDLLDLF